MGRRTERTAGTARWTAPRILAIAAGLLLAALALWTSTARVHASSAEPPAFVPQGEKLLPNDVTGPGHVGRSVSLSSDGNIALVGAPHDSGEAGAAWVFVRTGTTWSQQAKLSVGKEAGSNFFGRAVALSADGSTAIVGDPGNATRVGAAWVFVHTGATWTLQGKLTASDEAGAGQFGRAVALSGDGSLALIGGYTDAGNTGAAWTFARSGSTWSQQGSKLTGAEASGNPWFGTSVALSSEGTTALVGGSNDERGVGAAWAYTRSISGWEQIGPKLTASDESGAARFGEAVALSASGDAALVGAPDDAGETGAAWVFGRSGSTWQQEGTKLTGADEVAPGLLGYSVSLSGDGQTALAGGYRDNGKAGAAWVFKHGAPGWEQDGRKLTSPDGPGTNRFGFGVALSGDSSTALVGSLTDEGGLGAAWVFVRAPQTEEPEPVKTVEETHTVPTTTGTETTPTTTTSTTSTATTSTAPPTGGVLSTIAVASPTLAIAGNVEPVSGHVFYRLPHSKQFVELPGLRQIPFGTIVDAREGSVVVTAAHTGGGEQTGEFFSGEFMLTQSHNGMVTATLVGGGLAQCAGKGAHHASVAAAKRHRKLWANAHGTFSTKGNYAVGAVQGTEWLTEDTCQGTLIRVTRDKVKVTNLRNHHSVMVLAGHSIFVKKP
jgi:hypothetical protein